ncbi:hypothetical protein [Paenibacillus ihuae]|uniref:hypothetical protein n=1 Tax=Paenibacillus ihuae TaxID=1232431 RepID=UPI0006D55BC7|nr:hypothetical protein [Paenibacillus ihuae]
MSTAAQLDKDTGTKVVITMRDYGLPTIEEFHEGVSLGVGSYTHETIARSVIQSLDYTAIKTPILPRNAIYYSEGPSKRYIILEIPPHCRKVFYHNAEIEDVPFPRLLFCFELMVRETTMDITDVYIAALEDQLILNEESKVYFYPYTNVANSFSVCWGGQKLPSIERVSQLATIPEMFFNSPNSDCYYTGSNISKLPYRELVEQIKGTSFPDEYLKETGYKLQEWIQKMTSSI